MSLPMDPPSRRELRIFGVVGGGLVAVLLGLALPWALGTALPVWLRLWTWGLGGALCLWGLAWPAGLAPLYRGWMRLGLALGWLNTLIVLVIAYLLLFIPVGLGMRLLCKDPLLRRWDKTAKTYRAPRRASPNDHFERPY